MKKLILAALITASLNLNADIATVVAIRGDVATQETVLAQGAGVNVGDTITSQDKSFAVLQFVDGAKVTIRPDSSLVIEEYSYLEGDKDNAKLNLLSGGLRIVTGAMAKTSPDDYTLETPVALMGVRGTEFSIQLMK
jgi:hypothetical protein